jgi:hypothetical protein
VDSIYLHKAWFSFVWSSQVCEVLPLLAARVCARNCLVGFFGDAFKNFIGITISPSFGSSKRTAPFSRNFGGVFLFARWRPDFISPLLGFEGDFDLPPVCVYFKDLSWDVVPFFERGGPYLSPLGSCFTEAQLLMLELLLQDTSASFSADVSSGDLAFLTFAGAATLMF